MNHKQLMGDNVNNPSTPSVTGPNGGSNVASGASESIIADEDGQTLGTLLKLRIGSHNVGVKTGIPSVQYNGYYGTNLFVKSNTHAIPDDKYTAVALSVAHTALHY